MARMFLLPIVSVLLSIIVILILSIPNYHVDALLPIMPDGFKPILLGTYFSYGFPYVELGIMTMLLPYVRKEKQRNLSKGMFWALCINGFFLLAVTLSTIMVLGPMAGDRLYSMFEVARTVDLLEVIQRIESLVGISLIMASFMKATIVLFILNLSLAKLFNLKDDRILVFPLTMICFLYSMKLIEHGQAHWVNTVTMIHPLWGTLAYSLPLLIVVGVAAIRGGKLNKS